MTNAHKCIKVSYNIRYIVCLLHVSATFVLIAVHFKGYIMIVNEPMHRCKILSFNNIHGLKYIQKYKIWIKFMWLIQVYNECSM
jgi:hypothetical protein